jgi:hypothetical protein
VFKLCIEVSEYINGLFVLIMSVLLLGYIFFLKISILFLKNDDIFCIISGKTGFSKNILIIK